MYIVAIAWIYVVLMMSVAEAFGSQGTVLGAVITFLLYGVLPLALVLYILNTPKRKARMKAQENARNQAAEEAVQVSALPPDAGCHAPSAAQDPAVSAVRKKP